VIQNLKFDQSLVEMVDLDESLDFWKLFYEKRAKKAHSGAVSTFHR
jgi:hypothetical protein